MSQAAPATSEAINAVVPRAWTGVPKKFSGLLALDDFEIAARRRLPKMYHSFAADGSETNSALRANRESFSRYALLPRALIDVAGRSGARELFGKDWSAPFGIAPMGGAGMFAFEGDLALAEAAGAENIPFIMSASSIVKLEEVQQRNPEAWFQAYLPGDPARIEPMLPRLQAAGYRTLVITADVPVLSNRENNTRNGFSMPLKITPRTLAQLAARPRWLCGTILKTFIRRGMPHFENMDAVRGPPMLSQGSMRNFNDRDKLSWAHIALIRKRWSGKLIVKGLLAADDTRLAREAGADGVIISNHGGRQLDCAVAPLAVLAEAKAQAGGMAVMLDGGIRRGTDILKALALGADFVFIGRPFLFAASIGGADCVRHAISLLKEEVSRDMALLGVNALDEATPEFARAV